MNYFIIFASTFILILGGCSNNIDHRSKIEEIAQQTKITIPSFCSGKVTLDTKNNLLDRDLESIVHYTGKNLTHLIYSTIHDQTIDQNIVLTGSLEQLFTGDKVIHDFNLFNTQKNDWSDTIANTINQTQLVLETQQIFDIISHLQTIQNTKRIHQDQETYITDSIVLSRDEKTKTLYHTGLVNISISKNRTQIRKQENYKNRELIQDHKTNKIHINLHNRIDQERQLTIQSTITNKANGYRNITATILSSPPKGDLFRRHQDIKGNLVGNFVCDQTL